MIQLQVSRREVEAALPFLGTRLARWRAGVAAETAWGALPLDLGADGPRLTGRSIFVSQRGVEPALTALLGLRGLLLDRLTLRDGLAALRAIDPVLRAVEDVFARERLKEAYSPQA